MLSRLLLSPLTLGILLALALWRGRQWPRSLRRLCAAALIACYVAATPLGAAPMSSLLEHAADTRCAAPTPRAVVVLGGGVQRDAALGEVSALSLASLRRVIGAAAWWRQHAPDTLFVITGGNVYGGPAEATLMADLAQRLGVPATVLRVDATARTTWQNAANLAALRPALPRHVWLVTSAAHLPRALWSFRHAGFAPCAVAVDRRAILPRSVRAVLPSVTAIAATEAVWHEVIGLAWYRVRAWWAAH